MVATTVEQRFMQQGLPAEEPTKLPSHFRALRFQPSIAGPLMLLGIIIQARTQWSLVCTAFNLRKMYKAWAGRRGACSWAATERAGAHAGVT
jgi:hypothetical protein